MHRPALALALGLALATPFALTLALAYPPRAYCPGYKVLKASIEVACPVDKPLKLAYYSYYFGSWQQSWLFFLPALPIGVSLHPNPSPSPSPSPISGPSPRPGPSPIPDPSAAPQVVIPRQPLQVCPSTYSSGGTLARRRSTSRSSSSDRP